MSSGRGGALYTPELLSLAVSLAERPFDPAMPLAAETRSRTCGSALRLSCSVDVAGRVEAIGLQVSACAVGQAAAAIFAAGAQGCDVAQIAYARDGVAAWLDGSGPQPEWPGIAVLDPARAHSARHSAVMLAWDAALAALSNREARG